MCPIVRDPLRREHPLELVYFLLSVTSEQNKGAQVMSSRRSGESESEFVALRRTLIRLSLLAIPIMFTRSCQEAVRGAPTVCG
jgi:hypothetical protein